VGALWMNELKTYKNRHHLLDILGGLNIEYACEVGVQEGIYSKEILSRIPSLKKLYLVDLWQRQENYKDIANISDENHNKFLEMTNRNVDQWNYKVEILRGYSNEMCHMIPDESLDWVYVDARHDYCGCREDIEAYWPKIKPSGIMSGHDYHDAEEVRNHNNQDWSVCADGSIHEGAVQGAVDEFAENNGLQVLVSYAEEMWHSWSILKQE